MIRNRKEDLFFSAPLRAEAKRSRPPPSCSVGFGFPLVHSLRASPAIFLVSVLIFHSAWALEFVPEVWEMLTPAPDAVDFGLLVISGKQKNYFNF